MKNENNLLLKNKLIAQNVANFLECELIGDRSKKILRFSSVESVWNNSLLFLTKGYNLEHTISTIITTKEEYFKRKIDTNTYLLVDNPRLEFARVLQKYYSKEKSIREIDKTAVIDKTVSIEGNVYIGKNVRIQPFTTIGSEGMGFIRDKKGQWVYFPQIGGVIIEDNVIIGTGSNINRGTLFNTIIKEGTIISNHCNIGHNSIIGKHSFIGGTSNLGGKTIIGDYSFIGMRVVTSKNKIGNNVMIGMGSVVTKDIPDNVLAYGNPARIVRDNSEIWEIEK